LRFPLLFAAQLAMLHGFNAAETSRITHPAYDAGDVRRLTGSWRFS
jgi:hypothetical protein